MKKILLFLTIFFLVAGIIFSTGAQSVWAAEKDAKYGGILKRNHTGMPTQFGFPSTIVGADAAYVCYSLETLLLPSTDTFGKWDPVLAERWEIAPDKSSYTFYLKKGVKFHDGTDFNAQAVKWNLEIIMESPLPFLKKVKSIVAVDDYTLKFNLSSWDPLLLCDLSDTVCRLMSPAAYYTHGEMWNWTHPVGTGPWMLKDYKHKEYVKFERNPNYWDKDAHLYIDEMHFSHIQDPMTTMAEILRGNMHSAVGNITFAAQFDGKEGFNNNETIPMQNVLLFYNATDPSSIWSDVRMRHALEYAIDKEGICKTVGKGIVETRNEIIYPFRKYGKLAEPRKYDPEKARKLMADAGQSKEVEVELFVSTRIMTDLVLALLQNLSDVGIKANLSKITPVAMQDKIKAGPAPNVLWVHSLMSNAPNPLFFANNLLSPQSPYISGLKRPSGFDDLIAQAMEKVELSEQVQILEKAEKLAYEDAMFIPLWSNPFINVNSKKVHDAKWFNFGQDKSNLNNAWIEK